MKITIREFKTADKAEITRAVEKLHDYIVVHDPLNRIRKMPGYVAFETNEMLKTVRKQHGKVYIAEDDGAFVGFIAGFVTDKQSEENLLSVVRTQNGVISDVYVDEAFRGQGIGEKLINKMELYLKEVGCDSIWIRIVAYNDNAHKFYKKMGYDDREISLLKKI